MKDMSYLANITVVYPCVRQALYEALCNLSDYPAWHNGMVNVSHTGPMHEGLVYEATTNILGRDATSSIRVVQLIPDHAVVLESAAGVISFHSVYEINDLPSGCELYVRLRISYSRQLFSLAQPVAEAVAENWLLRDFETLRDLLASKA